MTVAAGIIGNVLEWYDFALYGFMASILSRVFFPTEDPLISLIAAYGVFAVGFVMRPLGSVLFGWLGDTIGRSRTLVLSVAMMALPTLLLGLLPSHASIGIAAPVLLTAIRMIQGLSVGGEFATSVTYLVETAPSHRRGLAGSWANMGSLIGMLLGSAAAAVTTSIMTQTVLEAWGWRLPFLLGGVLGGVALLLRKDLPESPQFARYEAARCPNSPIREAFHCNRAQMVQGGLFASGYGAVFYLVLVYLPTWLEEVTDISLGTAMRANTLTMTLLLPLIPIAGWVSDRWIRRSPLLLAAFLSLGIAGSLSLVWMRTGSLTAMIVGQLVMGAILAVPLGAAPALFTELFPEDDRLSGYSIVFNVGLGIVGGLTPMLASWLMLVTGTTIAPVGMLIGAVILAMLGLGWMHDASRTPLRTTCAVSVHQAMTRAGCTRYEDRGNCEAGHPVD
ncbi:MFS transporter [Halomonas nitroreducens]|uniref:MFS transporter n=2 Tax=Halomonas nitroreducens TaxID=447425 RepID=A0A3S0HRE6_9GAMM|nr:MFS transporter [Halomonas nitroreducens]